MSFRSSFASDDLIVSGFLVTDDNAAEFEQWKRDHPDWFIAGSWTPPRRVRPHTPGPLPPPFDAEIMASGRQLTPQQYGTMIHGRFALALEAERIPGLEVEQSFIRGRDADYGELGSKRTDIIFRDDNLPGKDGRGRVVAVWDFKTGATPSMPESRKRALTQAIHDDMGLAAATPVFVLHVPVGWASRP